MVGKEELTQFNLLQLRDIFNVTDSFDKSYDEPWDDDYDPYMAYNYKVTEGIARILQPYMHHKVELKNIIIT